MRSLIVALVFVGCTAEESSPPSEEPRPREATPEDIPSRNSSGGTPANICGGATSASAVGCNLVDIENGHYCSDYRVSPRMPGKCLAPLTTGTMSATIDGETFSATKVGARRLAEDIVEIAGFADGTEALRLTIGGPTGTKANCYSLGFTETRVGPVWASWAGSGTCTFELTDDGSTSGIVTGTFTATIRESALADAPSRDVAAGTFSVTLSK